MNGLDLARALREDRPGMPVVLISGYSMALAGIHEFIVLRKPCTEDEMVGALLEAVGGPVER
jgi:YesN/AraC family two-component response regulator